jgi:sugar lactone lactonase YvrE
MNKKITFLKPLTAVTLFAALIALNACRKTEKISPSIPEVPFTVASSVVPNVPLFVSTAAGDGTVAQFNLPSGVATDASGNVYVADMANHRIRKITAAGVVSTFAGSGNATYGDGTGTAASFNTPSSVATDAAGNVYVADKNNQLIRKITPDGTVSTLAGGFNMPGNTEGPGLAARFNYPAGVAVDGAGNILVADSANHKIRKITADGVVSTFAGSGLKGAGNGPTVFSQFNGPVGVTVDGSGNVFVADAGNNKIRKISGGVVSTLAGGGAGDESGFINETGVNARFNNPTGVVADGAGNVYVADKLNHAIRQVTPAGVVTTVSGNGTANFVNGAIAVARFSSPAGIAIDAAGKLFVADQSNQRIRGIGPRMAIVSTFAGNGFEGYAAGVGTSAQFARPIGLFTDLNGVYVADYGNHVTRLIRYSDQQVFTTNGTPQKNGYVDGSAFSALFDGPSSIIYQPACACYVIADSRNNAIRKRASLSVFTAAGSIMSGFVDAATTNARFSTPYSVASDGGFNIYVADGGNNAIRKIDFSGNVTTLAGGTSGDVDGQGRAAQFRTPFSLAVDRAGNIYVADFGNHKIRKVTPSGSVTTFAGTGVAGFKDGPALEAQFNNPQGVAVDSIGNVYVSDTHNNAVRMISATGQVSTLAGAIESGFVNGPGELARFNLPMGIALDASGNIYVADYFNHSIRKITIQ